MGDDTDGDGEYDQQIDRVAGCAIGSSDECR